LGPSRGWPGLGIGELWLHRAVAVALARRTLMVRYRQTYLGALWVLIQPLLMAVVFTIFFGMLARVPTDGVPFAVFFMIGLVFYNNAVKIFNEGGMSIVANSGLVQRIYLPRATFPISVSLASLVDFAFTFLALLVVMLWYSIEPTGAIIIIPLLLAISFTTALGMAFWVASLSAAYRDLHIMLPFLSQVWMFASPIIYSVSVIPDWALPFYYVNPLALVITEARWALTGSAPAPLFAWFEAIAVAGALIVTGYLMFRSRQRTFADLL
jgi:lipopolysaccharide transport system permease protein